MKSSELDTNASMYTFFSVLIFGTSMLAFMALPLDISEGKKLGIGVGGIFFLFGAAWLAAKAVNKICGLIQLNTSATSGSHPHGGSEG